MGGSIALYWRNIFTLDSVDVWFSSNEGFLTFNVSSQRHNLTKLTHYDESKKLDYGSQIVTSKENLLFSYGGSSQGQASDTNQWIKALHHGCH